MDILLVGAGGMALEHQKVLNHLGVTPIVMTRSEASANRFFDSTGIRPSHGDLEANLASLESVPETAFVTVNAQYLAAVTKQLIEAGVKRLLVEKPAALDFKELDTLLKVSQKHGAEVAIAYNRRFMASTLRTKQMLLEDGGIRSLTFNFSEPSKRIGALDKPTRELSTWFYGNSSHVVDMAFFLFGAPSELHAQTVKHGVDWHPDGAIFVGFGKGQNDSLINWHSNWQSPGRWGLEALSSERRIIMQPLEKIRVQDHNSFQEVDVELEDQDDLQFKPGLLRQSKAFLFGEGAEDLLFLPEHADHMTFYETIRLGGLWQKDA